MSDDVRTRLFLEEAGSERISTSDRETMDVARVLRMRPNQRVVFFKNDPFDYEYSLQEINRRELVFQYEGRKPNAANPHVPCFLIQAAGKMGKNEEIVRHGTALGVTDFLFFQADRSIGRIAFEKLARLRKIAIESCRQCGRSVLPTIESRNENLQVSLRSVDRLPVIAFSPDAQTPFYQVRREDLSNGAALVVGPEGGFSPEEQKTLEKKAAYLVGLGPRTLRMELASVAALALVQSVLIETET